MISKFLSVAAIALAIFLGGCATNPDGTPTLIGKLENAAASITQATVDPQAIIIAANTFDALEATGKNYINPKLNPRCNGANGPVCRDPGVTAQINAAIRSGRVARNNAKQFLRDHPGQLGTQGLLDALNAAVSTLQSIFIQYNIGA